MFAFATSPIAMLEARYQRRAPTQPRRWRAWLLKGAYLLALVVALVIFGGELVAAVFRYDATRIYETLNPLITYMAAFTTVMFLRMLFQIMAAGANSIAREKQSGTWDVVLMTGVDARRIVWSKWWATVRGAWRMVLLLLPLRVGLALVISSEVTRIFGSFLSQGATFVPPHPLGVLLVAPIALVFMCAAVALAAAIGVLASAALKRPVHALAAGVVVYVVLVGGMGLVLEALRSGLYANQGVFYGGGVNFTVLNSALMEMGGAVMDNGTIFSALPAMYRNSANLDYDVAMVQAQQTTGHLWALAGVAVMFIVGIWGALRLAQAAAVRGGALRPNKIYR